MLLHDRPLIEPLAKKHDRSSFSCGILELDRYIQKQASQDARRRVARVFVASLDVSPIVVGYYSLSAASIELEDLPDEVRKKLPQYPVPAARIGRLAVDETHQGKGLGGYLLMDALNRVIAAGEVVAMHMVIVEATDESAKRFYEKYGFRSLPETPLRLFIPLETLYKMGG